MPALRRRIPVCAGFQEGRFERVQRFECQFPHDGGDLFIFLFERKLVGEASNLGLQSGNLAVFKSGCETMSRTSGCLRCGGVRLEGRVCLG